jgi:hypothetical protein
MAKKKNKQTKTGNELNEPAAAYAVNNSLLIFSSLEEQEQYNRMQMIRLTPLERLQQLRKMINLAYGMHGFDPDNLPTKHKLTIL